MGKPMAKNLIKAGHSLVVHNRSRAAVDELVALGAEDGKSPRGVAAAADLIFTMLPNSPDVRQVVEGGEGIVAGARPGIIHVDLSSIAPDVARELAEKEAMAGITLLDAPVSGGEPKAIDGTLAIMVGGPEDIFDRVKPVLLAMGSSVVRVGDIGAGNITKLANQAIVALNIAAMSEALVLAKKAGADPRKVYEAIRGGLAGSTVLDAKVPKVLAGDFSPGFRIELHIKDLLNVMHTAHGTGTPLPLSAQVLEFMQALKTRGLGANDHCGLIEFYEQLAGAVVRDE